VIVDVDVVVDGDGDVNDPAEKPSHVAVAVKVNVTWSSDDPAELSPSELPRLDDGGRRPGSCIFAIHMHIIRVWIEREATGLIGRAFRGFPAVLLTGPRQVGKTSLLRHLYPNAHYVSFDSPALARSAEDSPLEFLEGLREPTILDEVQYVPGLFRQLKAYLDARPKTQRLLLTGSQSFPLMEGVAESLAGRCAILELSSLSWPELARARTDVSELQYIVRGGYPGLYAGEFDEPELWYSSYVASYLERDVRNLKNVGDLRDFDRFLRASALRSGQLLSYSDLARDVGVAPNTAKAWLSVLRASGQIFLLEPYHRSLGKRLVKSPKLYFLDTGLLCHLVGIESWEALRRSALAGAIWETHVVGQVVRHFQARGKRPPLWFWRTAGGEEVDLIIERGARFVGVEAKLSEAPGAESVRGFEALRRFYGEDALDRAYVACRPEASYTLNKRPKTIASSTQALLAALDHV
jgi:uncharacterized protein